MSAIVGHRFALLFDQNRFLYSGNGNQLELYDFGRDEVKLVDSQIVLPASAAIKTITRHLVGIVITGQGFVTIVDAWTLLPLTSVLDLREFILETAVLEDDSIILVTFTRQIVVLRLEQAKLVEVRRLVLGKRSTIYSALLCGNTFDTLELFSGGIFGQVDCYNFVSGPELRQTLKIHEGMVFCIRRVGDFIFTVSDDRSVAVTRLDTGKRVIRAFRHSTRLHGLAVDFPRRRVVTAGSEVCVWDLSDDGDLKLAQVLDTGVIDVRCVVIEQETGRAVLASSFGSLTAFWPLTDGVRTRILELPNVVRTFVTNPGVEDLIFLDSEKSLTLVDSEGQRVFHDPHCSLRFDTISISGDGRLLAVTNDWRVLVFDAATLKLRFSQVVQDGVLGGVLFVGHRLLAFGKNGNGLGLIFDGHQVEAEKWHVTQGLPVKSGVEVDGRVFMGLSTGFVSIFDPSSSTSIPTVSSRLHENRESILALISHKDALFAATFDGRFVAFAFDAATNQVEILQSRKVLERTGGFVVDSNDRLLLWGFRTNVLHVVCPSTQATLAVFDCGGGNRICRLHATNEHFVFCAIAKGKIHVAELRQKQIDHVVGPFHKHTVYGAVVLSGGAVCTVSIDTEICLLNVDPLTGRLEQFWRSRDHKSSVHAITGLDIEPGFRLVATVGGCSELRLWRARDGFLQPLLVHQSTLKGNDTRYVNVQLAVYGDQVIAFAAASIREFHVFYIRASSESAVVERVERFKPFDYSTPLKIAPTAHPEFVFVGWSSGTVYCVEWGLPAENKSILARSQPTGGISALVALDCLPRACIAGTAGGAIVIMDFDQPDEAQKSVTTFEVVFSSTLTGLHCKPCPDDPGARIVASAATYYDLKLSRLERVPDNDGGGVWQLTHLREFKSIVGDIIGLVPFADGTVDDDDRYVVYGQGIEVVSFEAASC